MRILYDIKARVRAFVPERILLGYHFLKAQCAALLYGYPTRGMFVVGITGTKGKSTTANFMWGVLQASGEKTGLIGTANIRIGEHEEPNAYHMTMPSPFVMQRTFARMRRAGCTALVMEVTSEGIKQHRHRGIAFDVAVFTNLSPEHLPSHGNSFACYKATKMRFFRRSAAQGAALIVNADDAHACDFCAVPSLHRITRVATTFAAASCDRATATVHGTLGAVAPTHTTFRVGAQEYVITVGGEKNACNALLAVALGRLRGIAPAQIAAGLASLATIPGRMEAVRVSDRQDITVFVDYAHEERSMDFLLSTMRRTVRGTQRVIVVLGAEGGGRDPRKRAIMGRIAAEKADMMVVTTVDPFDDDPRAICEDIAAAAMAHGKVRDADLFVDVDRRDGIRRALALARAGDIVCITGKGAEKTMILAHGRIVPWDERAIVRALLREKYSAT